MHPENGCLNIVGNTPGFLELQNHQQVKNENISLKELLQHCDKLEEPLSQIFQSVSFETESLFPP